MLPWHDHPVVILMIIPWRISRCTRPCKLNGTYIVAGIWIFLALLLIHVLYKVQPRGRKRKNIAHKLGMSAADIAVYATAIEGD